MAVNVPKLDLDGETPSEKPRGLRKGIYLLPSAFTAANIAMGYFAIMGALRGFQYLNGAGPNVEAATMHFNNSALAISWAILFDTLDGRIARMTKTTTEIGVQLDSISDVLTFGIAPAILTYTWSYGSVFSEGTPQHKLGWFVSFMFLISGAFRLARFNVQATRPRPLKEGTAKLDKKSFVGLPIPAAAGLLAAIIHFSPAPLLTKGANISAAYSILMMVLIALLSGLMVSTFRYSSFKTVGGSARSTRLAMLLVAAIGMLLWLFSHYVLLILASVYVLHGPLFKLLAYFRRHSHRTEN